MENKWSEDQSTQITSLYEQLKGEYQKKAHKKLFGGSQLDYSDAFNTLTSLIKQQEKGGGLEGKVTETASNGILSNQMLRYALGFAVVAGLVLGLPPYIP